MEPAELAAFRSSLPPPPVDADTPAGRAAGHIRGLAVEVARELLRLLPAGAAGDALEMLGGVVTACDAALCPSSAGEEGAPA